MFVKDHADHISSVCFSPAAVDCKAVPSGRSVWFSLDRKSAFTNKSVFGSFY